jgi:hypothetical protein
VIARDSQNKELGGYIVYCTSSDGDIATRSLAVTDGGPRDILRVEHRGIATIEVPIGQHTWLCAAAREYPLRQVYLRVAANDSDETREIRFTSATAAVHVSLFESDFASPAAGQEIAVHALGLRESGAPIPSVVGKTDRYGYCCLPSLGPGRYFICAPGAEPGEPVPWCQGVVLDPSAMPGSVVCVLVRPEKRGVVLVERLSGAGDLAEQATVLFAQRFGSGEGEVFPLSESKYGGWGMLQASLPVGTYLLNAIPLGAVEFVPEVASIEIQPGRTTRLQLQTRANSLETRIVLNGVHDHELPLSVFGWIQGQIISPHQHLLVIGPSAWSKRVLSVRLPRYPTMLVACSRSGLRISQDAIAGSDHEASVRFVPAARVDITWIPARMSTGVTPIVEVKSENRVDLSGDGTTSHPGERALSWRIHDERVSPDWRRGVHLLRFCIKARTLAASV